MRTTLTLDEDNAATLEQIRRESEDSLKEIVNRALRLGLRQIREKPEPRQRFVTRTVSLGECKIGDLTDISEALAVAEGEGFK